MTPSMSPSERFWFLALVASVFYIFGYGMGGGAYADVPAWVTWMPLTLNAVCQVAIVTLCLRRAQRRDRAHIARLQAAWDYELTNLRQVNLEADELSKQVVASAKKFRETFGIEELPAAGRFVARRPSGWN